MEAVNQGVRVVSLSNVQQTVIPAPSSLDKGGDNGEGVQGAQSSQSDAKEAAYQAKGSR